MKRSVPDRGFIIRQGERGPIVDGSFNGVHLTIFPRPYDPISYEVHITAETPDGKPDFSKDFNSMLIDASSDDIGEAADMYMRRLQSGVDPKDIFKPETEAQTKVFKEAFERLSKA